MIGRALIIPPRAVAAYTGGASVQKNSRMQVFNHVQALSTRAHFRCR